jgi:4-azaleucine resistance transporter AzlC
MRSKWRTIDRGVLLDVALVCLADGVVGISFGAITVGAGASPWLPVAMSVFVFAGASQFLFIGIVATGASPLTAATAGLLVNTRHIPFGLAVADLLGSGWRRAAGAHLMADETVAFALAQRSHEVRRAVYWLCGTGIFVFWNLGTMIGAQAGHLITDTAALGLDAAFPAVLVALVLPALRERQTRVAALIGAAIALATTPFLPAGVPVLLSLLGLGFTRVAMSR